MSELIRLELKYCERCGGLHLRRAGLTISFCKSCQRIERDMPAPRRATRVQPIRRDAVVLPFRPASVRPARVPDLQACCEGEQA